MDNYLIIAGIDACQKKRYYHIILIVTVEQEEAIVDLFKHKQWEYMKAGKSRGHEFKTNELKM